MDYQAAGLGSAQLYRTPLIWWIRAWITINMLTSCEYTGRIDKPWRGEETLKLCCDDITVCVMETSKRRVLLKQITTRNKANTKLKGVQNNLISQK